MHIPPFAVPPCTAIYKRPCYDDFPSALVEALSDADAVAAAEANRE